MVVELGGGYRLRQAEASDHAAMEMVCLRTGDSGADATAREDDPRLLGLIYAVPYQVFAPEFAFVIEGPNGVCGYVLAVTDSAAYYAWAQREWFPGIAATVADPGPDKATWTRGSDWARYEIHHPDFTYPEALHPYPAHGHIDLLPEAQGRGFGRRALEHVMAALARAGAPGMHLGVSTSNHAALAFYERLGFARLTGPGAPTHAVYMVKAL
ncbi:MAG: GNAT family N-acetyltransferase [Devosia sp.]|uniref:GNAT family N-acetyltransferase n=1 Tax=Devosia sp. TaxID=1871048 RepID=UPI001AC6FC9D|nr:GNAT family N-acetyltransferase [Devosia sp.]MBN9308979.1 GNAT family N-acetyltransferase [Devosia sp.]MBN9315388.1 GNAT family N-acetyltransferase [Devosia sp.]